MQALGSEQTSRGSLNTSLFSTCLTHALQIVCKNSLNYLVPSDCEAMALPTGPVKSDQDEVSIGS